MPTHDPEILVPVLRLLFERMELDLSVRAISALRFQEWVELEGGKRGSAVVETPAVLVGDKIAIRVEEDYYRVYNLDSTPYHGLFYQGVCKTANARHTIQAAVMAAIHEHFTGLFQEHDFGAFGGG